MSSLSQQQELPRIIQGGMGVGVSSWRLAQSVSSRGHLGVVSGTALDAIQIRRLQNGDAGGHVRRALAAFPYPEIAERLVETYYVAGGKQQGRPYPGRPKIGHQPSQELQELLVAANFVEVFLAKEGHTSSVGINYLNKIQSPLLPSLYGAILAGVDVVIVGAGIPLDIPRALQAFASSEVASTTLHVHGATDGKTVQLTFDPKAVLGDAPSALRRPRFFPVVSSVTLAAMLIKKCPGQIDGLIVESHIAGGHNAPPRGKMNLDEDGEPEYGPRDEVDLSAIRALGVPFWLAGGCGSPEKLQEAQAHGAAGVQIGSLFAFCQESGLRADIKEKLIAECRAGTAQVYTDPLASPTGFPFKILSLPGTLSDVSAYAGRTRQCDLGYLREAYQTADGTIDWRCAAEDPATYKKKGGKMEDTIGRKCICNGLISNIGLPQVRGDGKEEIPLVTCGDDLSGILRIIEPTKSTYSSSNVLDYMLS